MHCRAFQRGVCESLTEYKPLVTEQRNGWVNKTRNSRGALSDFTILIINVLCCCATLPEAKMARGAREALVTTLLSVLFKW